MSITGQILPFRCSPGNVNDTRAGLTSPPVVSHFHSEIIQCGLQDRTIGGLVDLREASWRIVFIQSGEVELRQGASTVRIAAPALVWQPLQAGARIRVRAGSIGAHLLLGEHGLSNAVGRKPEAAEIRIMAQRQVLMPLSASPDVIDDAARAFDFALREGQNPSPGSETIIEAQVRVLLVLLWRHAIQTQEIADAQAAHSQVLQRFRHLVEIHFRERWGVAAYARELGVSTDRLHDLSTRVLNKTPLRLIHERTIYEAQSLLHRSNRTVDQIADYLGFNSAGQFNKFFKSSVGQPPGQYRRSLRQSDDTVESLPGISYADWP